MKDMVIKVVKDFLSRHYRAGKPVLVGFSGGPDSMALLHLLLQCNIAMVVAHVDHGWRKESRKEAEQLKEDVEKLGLEFHLHRLKNLAPKENVARQARLKFFKKLYDKKECQALVLGHHGDDQSETVLKRVLEGGALGGIRPVAEREGMEVWRPLLKVKKKDLQAWLEKKGLKGLDDATNGDPKYLRGRMRKTIIPALSKEFGKNIGGNLCRLGESAQELEEYLEKKIKKFRVQEDQKRVWVDFPEELEPLEVKTFLKKFAEKNKFFLSYEALQTLYKLLERGASNRRVGPFFVEGRSIAIKKG